MADARKLKAAGVAACYEKGHTMSRFTRYEFCGGRVWTSLCKRCSMALAIRPHPEQGDMGLSVSEKQISGDATTKTCARTYPA